MKKILITGGCGFIGSHLAEMFVEKGYKVIAFDRYNSFNSWGNLENSKYKNEIEVVLGDIRDYDSVKKVVEVSDEVFHLAALIGIPYSYISPLAYIKTNVEGTYNILQASKESKINNIIITSTSEVYGSAQYVPIDENHPLVGQSPYSASKIAADQISISYYKSFKLPIKIVRPFNTFGPRQSLRAVIPTIVSQYANNSKFLKIGNTNAIRDLTYVTDTCEGIYKVSKKNIFNGSVVNIGAGKGYSVKNIINLIQKIYNVKIPIRKDTNRIRPKNSEVNKLVCNNNFLLKKTNWKPKIELQKGIKNYIDWFSNQSAKDYKIDLYNV